MAANRNARGSRLAMPGAGGANERPSRRRASRARCSAQRAFVVSSPIPLASLSSKSEAGRCASRASTSRRASACAREGRRSRASGDSVAARASANSTRPPTRASRGAANQSPNQDAARNSATSAPLQARGGQTRSQINAHPARRAKASSLRTGPDSLLGLVCNLISLSWPSKSYANQGGILSRPINSS